MNARLRRLFGHAQTSPIDSFKWSDKRPKIDQVVSGIRIAGGMIAGFAVMGGVLACLSRLSEEPPTQTAGSIFISWTVLIAAAVIMLWTANRWAAFVTVFFFGRAVFGVLGALLFEPDSYYSWRSISRTELAELLGYCLIVVALTSRFLGMRPVSITGLDRIALTFFVLACFKQVVTPYRFPPWSLFWGGLALLAAWSVHRFRSMKRHPRRLHLRD